jgi:hypothetical protein
LPLLVDQLYADSAKAPALADIGKDVSKQSVDRGYSTQPTDQLRFLALQLDQALQARDIEPSLRHSCPVNVIGHGNASAPITNSATI